MNRSLVLAAVSRPIAGRVRASTRLLTDRIVEDLPVAPMPSAGIGKASLSRTISTRFDVRAEAAAARAPPGWPYPRRR